MYKKHAAEKNEMRVMARYINASLAMAKDAGMSGRGRMAEIGGRLGGEQGPPKDDEDGKSTGYQ